MFILEIFLFFFFQSTSIASKICFSGGIRRSISNRSEEDESEERREIELLPRGFDQTYVG